MYVPAVPRRHRASDAVRALALDLDLAGRLSRRLDHALRAGSAGRATLRESVRETAALLRARGLGTAQAAERLGALVEEHARERGWTKLSVLSGQPRCAELSLQVREWVRGEPRVPALARLRALTRTARTA